MLKTVYYKPLYHILLIIILGILSYSNTFDVPFQYDDREVIVNNNIVKRLNYFTEPSKAKAVKGHLGYHTFRSRYVAYLTFALNYRLHGLDVTGYHILNLSIHISTAILLYLFVMLSFKTPYLHESPLNNYSRHIAFFTALIFVSHPVETEAVTYI